ncbi:hypothetical protein AVEN_178462-1 [Araneus ventricosus]|uniref:Uncharacterized protein n=1 Tax=Araneus ventricosus TaxID=182803 RepID=A0A4Y2CDM9_ARAVE|nr:hypothetical protein AVEN_178462-1 [Araneus ventricosus]
MSQRLVIKVPVTVKKQKPAIPLSTEFLKYFERKRIISTDDEHGNESELFKLPCRDELQIQSSVVEKTLATQNSSKMSFSQSGDFDKDGVNLLVEDVETTTNEPATLKVEYSYGCVKLREL